LIGGTVLAPGAGTLARIAGYAALAWITGRTVVQLDHLITRGQANPVENPEARRLFLGLAANAMIAKAILRPSYGGGLAAAGASFAAGAHELYIAADDAMPTEQRIQSAIEAAMYTALAARGLRLSAKYTGGPTELYNVNPHETPGPYYLENIGRLQGGGHGGQYIYVVTLDGELRIGKEFRQGHLNLAEGKPVLAAGVVNIDRHGAVTYLDDGSGHYQPSGPHPRAAALQAFKRYGFHIEGRYHELYGPRW
jgi:hypothetical protein